MAKPTVAETEPPTPVERGMTREASVETAVGARREMEVVPAAYWAKFCEKEEGELEKRGGKRMES